MVAACVGDSGMNTGYFDCSCSYCYSGSIDSYDCYCDYFVGYFDSFVGNDLICSFVCY